MFDVADCISDSWFRLGFQNLTDQQNPLAFVTTDELYQFGDDAVKRLARKSALFTNYDQSQAVTAENSVYPPLAGELATESAWLAYSGTVQQLRITNVAELTALDAAWQSTAGPPKRISLNASGLNKVLYPQPVANATLATVVMQLPPDVAAGASTVPLSPVLQDYVTDAIIGAARGKESDSAMPEVTAHLKERTALYEQVIAHLWGAGRAGA